MTSQNCSEKSSLSWQITKKISQYIQWIIYHLFLEPAWFNSWRAVQPRHATFSLSLLRRKKEENTMKKENLMGWNKGSLSKKKKKKAVESERRQQIFSRPIFSQWEPPFLLPLLQLLLLSMTSYSILLVGLGQIPWWCSIPNSCSHPVYWPLREGLEKQPWCCDSTAHL